MEDRIERSTIIAAPVSRIWRALTDHEEFGQWFRVKLDAPFRVGEISTGQMTVADYEHIRWTSTTVRMEPERVFAFTWHPYAIDPNVDYSGETPTLVEFVLEPEGEGTKLTVIESGFSKLPAHRYDDAIRMNGNGWTAQMRNVKAHVES